jgi:hypothetical protein
MALKSFGRITVAVPDTAVQATVNEPAQADRFSVHSVMFERDDPNDTGLVYIGTSAAMNRTTLVGVIAILAVPTTNFLPVFTATITHMPDGVNVNEFWVDADEAGDSVLISGIEG